MGSGRRDVFGVGRHAADLDAAIAPGKQARQRIRHFIQAIIDILARNECAFPVPVEEGGFGFRPALPVIEYDEALHAGTAIDQAAIVDGAVQRIDCIVGRNETAQG